MESIRTRPRIKLTPTPTQIGLSVFTAIGIAAIWLIFAHYYHRLPDTIYTHFGPTGAPDATGPKSTLTLLPITASALYILFTGIMRVPFIYNYPVPITEANAERQYGNAVTLFYWLRAVIVWLFVYLEWTMIQTTLGRAQGLGAFLLPAVLVLTFVPMIHYVVRAIKDK